MKRRNFIKTIPIKLYLILAAILFVSFFSNDFGLVDIQKTAVILAAGIDRTENGFSLTAQIAVPKGSDRTTGGTSSVEIEAEGETVSDCVSLIFAKTGWVPKLVFCNLIVLGEEAVKENVISSLNYFLRNEYMPDSCLLAVCEGRAGDIISSASAIDDASCLAIEKLFSDAAEKSGRVMPCTMREFAIGYYGVSKSGYLPYLRMTKQKEGEESETPPSTENSGQASPNPEPQMIYSAEETALFSDGEMKALLTPEETMALSMLHGKVFAGTFNAHDGERPVTLSVVKNEGRVSLDMKDGPVARLSFSITLRLCCRGVTEAIDDIASDKVSSEVLTSAKQTLEGYTRSLWDKMKASGCDLFFLKRELYRSSLKQYGEWKDSLLSAVSPEIEVTPVSMK